jgi:HSP20 family protein
MELNRLSEQLSRLFDDDWSSPAAGGDRDFVPLADVEETDDAFLLDVDLPGVRKKDINIEIDGRRLVISGERIERERVGLLRRRTRMVGRFRLEVILPTQVDENGIEANIDDGVLHLKVPKSASGKRRRIEVS